MVLKVIRGQYRGVSYPIEDGKITIGRSYINTIQVMDENVSRKHCLIEKSGEILKIKDLGSRNKTLVNGKQIEVATLKKNDKIKVGNITFVLTDKIDEKTRYNWSIFKKLVASMGGEKDTLSIKADAGKSRLLNIGMVEEKDVKAHKEIHKILSTLYTIGNDINSIRDMSELLHTIMDHIFEVVNAERGVLFFMDDHLGKLVPKVIKTKRGKSSEAEVSISKSIINEILKDGMAILSYDALHDDRFRKRKSVILNMIRSIMCAPIKSKDNILGIIYLDSNVLAGAFDEDDLLFLSAIGYQAGIAIQNTLLNEDLEELFLDSIRTLVAAIDAKDPYTHGHSERVTAFSVAIGNELGLPKEEINLVRLSAILHDIGKIGIREDILNKPGKLTDEEKMHVNQHSLIGSEIIKNIKTITGIGQIIKGVRHHHEFYDGTGLPDGLKGEAIPLISRIIAVADAFDAITSNRPYRKGRSLKEAIDELKKASGCQFDQKVTKVFITAFKSGRVRVPEPLYKSHVFHALSKRELLGEMEESETPLPVYQEERRRFTRVDATISIMSTIFEDNEEVCKVHMKNMRGVTENISMGGMLFESDYAVPLSSILRIRIEVSSFAKPVEAVTKVARIEEIEKDKRYEIGVFFLSVSDAALSRLGLFLFPWSV